MPTKITRPQMDDAMLERCMEAITALVANPTRCPWSGLPLVDSKCNICFPPVKPSREFLISQAILNALPTYEDGTSWSQLGTPLYLNCLTSGEWVRSTFCEAVRAEFRKLEAQHAQ